MARMSWLARGPRRTSRVDQMVASATLARVAGAEHAAAVVRAALARTELERPVRRVALATIGDVELAERVAASLDRAHVEVAPAARLDPGAFDAVVAFAGAGVPGTDVVEALRPLESSLLGLVVVGTGAEEAPSRPDDGPDPLAALAELERAAGAVAAVRPRPPTPAPVQAPAPVPGPAEPPDTRDPEAERRLEERERELERGFAELAHRKAALNRIAAALQGASPVSSQSADDRLAQATARAEEAEARVRRLEARLAELEAVPVAAAQPEPAQVAERAPALGARGVTVEQLERLTEAARAEGRAEAEEWGYYVSVLREHADARGELPPQFDALIESVFGPALRA